MQSLDLLKAEASERRVYRTRSDMASHLRWHVQDYQARLPGTDWAERCQVLPKNADGSHDLALKHMIHWGKADARVIEKAFGMKLPPCVHAFYAEIQEAVLNWRNSYQILRPEHVVAWEREYRELSEDTDLPVRLIRFCKMPATGVNIAFRQHTKTGAWNICWAAVEDSTEDLQSPECDEGILAENLDEWLTQLMRDDGVADPNDRQWLERVG